MNYNQLLDELHCLADVKYNEFNSTIVNSGVKSMGVRMPSLRKLAKQISLSDALTFPKHEWLEVDTLVGMVVSAAKLPFEQKSILLSDFADGIENWSVCDCNTVKVPKAEADKYFDYFLSLLPSSKVFVCRYGVVNLLGNFLDETHIQTILDSLADITTYGNYYTDMGVAWLVATAAAKCRTATLEFLTGRGKTTLNVFTYNKALQKMRDSFRISDADKQLTYTLKR